MSEYGVIRTAVGQYIKELNQGRLQEGATLTSGSKLTSKNLALSAFETNGEIDPGDITLLAPAGLRAGASAVPISVFSGAALEQETLTLGEIEGVNAFEVPNRNFYPGSQWIEETGWYPGRTWVPRSQSGGSDSSAEEESKTTPTLVLVPDSQSFANFFGKDLDAVGGRPVEPGETFEIKSLTVASVGNSLFNWEFPDGYGVLFENGRPAALGGAVFDLAVLSTPSASVAGVEANPIVSMDSNSLLTDETIRALLRDVGISDADDVRWVEGPGQLSQERYLALDDEIAANAPESFTSSEPTIFDEQTTIETYAGVVNGQEGSWAVGVHIARATPEDHVLAIGMQRAPLESAGGTTDESGEGASRPFPIISWKNWYLDARAMMKIVTPRLAEEGA